MGPVADHHGTAATRDHAFRKLDEAIDATIAGESLYPDGAAFVPVDIEGVGDVIAREAREGRDIVLVYPDGSDRVLYVKHGKRGRRWALGVLIDTLRSPRRRSS